MKERPEKADHPDDASLRASPRPDARTGHSTKGNPMKTLILFLRKDDGQDMVEYALLASFISIVAIVALRAIGPLVRTIYTNIQTALT